MAVNCDHVTYVSNSMRVLAILLLCLPAARADEGMWPFNQFPKEAVAQKHKLDVGADFVDRLRMASVRLTGGSGSFVSPNGLVLTNQHLVSGCLTQHNSLSNGFYAASQADEMKCPGLEAQVLMSIADVSSEATQGKGIQQRNAAIERIEKECATKTGNRCTVVKLFSGGRYDLYQYKTYNDLRLVFAPENELAFFGRERDSITYLRYGLDAAFLRVYENGKPAATPHFFKWSLEPVKEDDLVLAVGDPAATSRLATSAQLAFYRDTALPLTIRRLQTRIAQVNAAPESPEKQALLTSFLSSYKLAAGKLIWLRDDRLVTRKTVFEGKIKRAVQASKAGNDGTKVWDEVATAYKNWTLNERPYQILEASAAPGSALFAIARHIVRHEDPGQERVNEPLEILMLTQYLEELRSLGEKEVPLKTILEGRTPQQAAEAYVKSSNMKDPAARQPEDVRTSEDGMIRLA